MPAGSGSITRTFESGLSSPERGVIVYVRVPGREDRNSWSTVFPRLIGRACTSIVALAVAEYAEYAPVPVRVASFVNVWVGGVPVPFVIWPARAVMVIVPATGVFAAIAPVFQR